jgi:HSP20 family protein
MTTLIRWEPFRDLTGLQGEVSRLMNGLFDTGARTTEGWLPALDVWETETELVYAFDLPGVREDEIAIAAHDDTLTISGSRARNIEEQDDRYYRFERRHGSFARSVGLPNGTDDSKITASYRDGVLEIHVPKAEEARPRRIAIEAKQPDVEVTAAA